MADIVPDSDVQQQAPRQWINTLGKLLVAVLVIVGLTFATRSAVESWNQQTQSHQQSLDDLYQQIDTETDPQRRQQLRDQAVLWAERSPSLGNLRWKRLVISAVLYAIGLLPAGLVLRLNCGLFGPAPRYRTAIAAQTLGHLGKYVPGKAMVIVIRAGVLARDQVSPIVAAASIFAETFLMMAVGAAIAGMVTLCLPVPSWAVGLALLMAVAAFIPTLPPIMRIILKRFAGSAVMKSAGHSASQADWRWSLKTGALTFLSWVFIGSSFAMIVWAIPSMSPLPQASLVFAVSTAAIGLAMVTGFASLLPGGAGVRELVLATILGVVTDPAHALLAAIAARLVFLLVEIVLGTLSWIWLKCATD